MSILVVMGIALFVLLIACVNLASLMLARTMKRSHEIGVQLALGATRWRSARQVLTEGLLVSLAGGLCGILAAPWIAESFATVLLSNRLGGMASLDTTLDARILGLTVGLAVGTALLFCAIPAWFASRRESHFLLGQGGRTITTSGRLGRGLVASQVALCLVLLIDAGLLVRTLARLRAISPALRQTA